VSSFGSISEFPVAAGPEGGTSIPPGAAPSQSAQHLLDQLPERRRQRGFMEVSQSLVLTTLAALAVIPRAPLYTQLDQKPEQEAFQPPNLALQLQPAAPQTPVGRFLDTPMPERIDKLEAHTLIVTRFVLEQAPFRQTDWPTPQRLHERDVHFLLPQPRPTEAAPEVPLIRPFDWPTPVRAKERDVHGLQFQVRPPEVAPGTPIIPIDLTFEVPRHPDPVVFDPPNLLTTTLFVTPVLPFRQMDWPNPVQAEQRQFGFAYNSMVPLLPPDVVQPTGNDEWIIRWRRRHRR
jgi:hypothetical protein